MNIHEKFAWLFAAVTAVLFAVKYGFGVAAIGFWTFLPLIALWWAMWFAGRKKAD